MTLDIETLLSRARLVPTAPYGRADIEAAEARVAARVAAHALDGGRGTESAGGPGREARPRLPTRGHPAARNLRALCEAFLTRPSALDDLCAWPAGSLPEPSGARILGGLLHLAGCEDSARFWWQYAAGAGDALSSYCLYLHHRAQGEDKEADWWLHHTDLTPATLNREATELEVATALDILAAMRRGQGGLPAALRALVEHLPGVVGFVDDDVELPLPDGDLAALVEEITAGPEGPARGARAPHDPLPERRVAGVHTVSSAQWYVLRWNNRDVEEALRQCDETVAS
ncbi:hypothetical protein OK074_3595 [Actinobacteria bacterium OK074]|nr:hypothetical protein OK074_3595 [Actinobacteria bacterium OK074]